MKTNKEVVVKEVNIPNTKDVVSVEGFITKAIENNLPVETMQRLFALRQEVKKEQAKEAFINAMSEFQAKCPIITKNKDVMNKDGRTVRYSYASLDSIVSQVKGILGNCGLAYTTNVVNEPGFITAICKITHNLGHSETSEFKIPIDTEGYMTAPQKYASALTFAKRYAFCNALGILTGEDDFDASDVEKKPEIVTIASIKGKVVFLLRELGVDTNKGKTTIVEAIKRLTGVEMSDDMNTLEEIKGRLEVLVQEKLNENA